MEGVDGPQLGLRDAVRPLEIEGNGFAVKPGRGISLTALEYCIYLILGKFAHIVKAYKDLT
jgi:hypothetical protein